MPESPVLLIGTTNPDKMAEIRHALEGLPVGLLSLADIAPIAEPDETGRTFAENARLKAETYAAASGLPTVAEDSGLAIDALGGRPGVESARYPGRTYADKFANLYRELAGAAPPWTARFVASVAFVDPNRALGRDAWFACEGRRGRISDS
jgi:XTP/dITP diphosphohydrolase